MYSYNEKFEGKLPVNNNFVLPDQYSSWKKEPEVIKLRKRVLIIIGILLGLSCINFIVGLILFVINDKKTKDSTEGISQVLSILWAVIYYGFGFYTAYRYYRTGLLVFGWSGILSLLISFVAIIIGLIQVMKEMKHKTETKITVSIIIIIFGLINTIIQILVLRYVFALTKLLKITKSTNSQRV